MTTWKGSVVVDGKAAVEGREVWRGGCKVMLPRKRRFYRNFTMVELWRWHRGLAKVMEDNNLVRAWVKKPVAARIWRRRRCFFLSEDWWHEIMKIGSGSTRFVV